jgi:hypothetical protein
VSRLLLLTAITIFSVFVARGAEPGSADSSPSPPETPGQPGIDRSNLVFRPIAVGGGELLLFVRPENAGGESEGGSASDRREVLYVHDPEGPFEAPHVLWRGEGSVAPRPLARLSQHDVLFDFRERAFVLNVSSGRVTPIMPADGETRVLLVTNGTVTFLHRPHTIDLIHGLSWDHTTQRWQYDRPADHLMSTRPGRLAHPVRLVEEAVEHVVAVAGQVLWIVLASPDRQLARVTEAGCERIAEWDEHWIPRLTKVHPSPDGTWLAFETCDDRNDLGLREIVVVDLPQKRVCHVTSKARQEEFGSDHTFIPVRWTRSNQLTFTESHTDPTDDGFVTLKLSTHRLEFTANEVRVLGIEDTPALQSLSTRSTAEGRTNRGRFEEEFGRLYFPGHPTPAIDLLDDDNVLQSGAIMVSPSGDWAVAAGSEIEDTMLIDGQRQAVSVLLQGWSYDLNWLPSVAAAGASRVLPDAWERDEQNTNESNE